MLLLIANALVFAVFIVLTLVPALYIYDPQKHRGETLGPPPAGTIISDDAVSHSVRQKVYLVFVIPAVTAANMLWLYFSYYRPLRNTQYKVEANVISLHMNRVAGLQQLRSAGIAGFVNPVNNTSMIRGKTMAYNDEAMDTTTTAADKAGSAGGGPGAGGGRDGQGSALARHARPAVVTPVMDVWALFPEVRQLIAAIAHGLVEPCQASEKLFVQGAERALGYFDTFAPQNGTYTSHHARPRSPSHHLHDVEPNRLRQGIDQQHTVILVPIDTPAY